MKTFKRLYESYKNLFWEIVRYLIVGGLATIVDIGLFFLMYELILPKDKFVNGIDLGLALSNTIGFIGGLLFNYVLSIYFVFRHTKNKDSGKSLTDFFIFSVIGIIGLVISNIGIQLLVVDIKVHVMWAKIIMTIIVLGWNYIGRKILIFK